MYIISSSNALSPAKDGDRRLQESRGRRSSPDDEGERRRNHHRACVRERDACVHDSLHDRHSSSLFPSLSPAFFSRVGSRRFVSLFAMTFMCFPLLLRLSSPASSVPLISRSCLMCSFLSLSLPLPLTRRIERLRSRLILQPPTTMMHRRLMLPSYTVLSCG